MRICHAFNMANDAFATCKGLRKIHIDADLVIQRPSHVASLPQWEDGEVDLATLGDPFNPNWDAFHWTVPHWIHIWDTRKGKLPFSRTISLFRLLASLREYDLVVGHCPFAAFADAYSLLWRRPYVLYDAGWIRYLHKNWTGHRQARRAYDQTKMIFFTNVDTIDLFRRWGWGDKISYTPFAIDTEKYAPLPSGSHSLNASSDGPVFLHPTRQAWSEKGNDKLFEAFTRYVRGRQPNAQLRAIAWGPDLPQTRRLVSAAGIERNVVWLPLMPKRDLIKEYHRADAVFDQFNLGAYGTTAPEAMSIGKPVCMYANSDHFKKCHNEKTPPVLNARTSEEIFNAFVVLEQDETKRRLGELARQWILDEHDSRKVASQHLQAYNEIIGA